MDRRISRVWGWTFLANGLILASGVITGILSARLLLPEGRGLLAAVIFWPHLIAGIGILSVNESITYRASLPDSDKEEVCATAVWLAIALAAIAAAVTFPLLPILLGPQRSEFVPLAQIYLIAFLPFNFIVMNLVAVDQGQLSFTRFNLLRLMQPLVYLMAALGLWLLDIFSVTGMVYAGLAGTLLSGVLRVSLLGKKILVGPSWQEAKRMLAMGSRFHLTNLLMFGSAEIDKVIIILFADNISLGIYSVGLIIASTGIGVIAQTFSSVLFPYISKSTSTDERRNLMTKSLGYAVLIMAVCNLPLIVISPWLVPFLFGKEFVPAVPITAILVLAFFFKGIRTVMVYNLRGMGNAGIGSWAEAIALAVFLTCTWPLFHFWKLQGICVALLTAHLTAMLYLTAYFKRVLNISVINGWRSNVAMTKDIYRTVRTGFSRSLSGS